MAYRVKKFRGYRRMLRKLIRVVEDYQPDWRPDEADGREEFLELDLYSHRFFHPRGKGRKALFSALLRKTEALIAAKPADLPFCKIFLFMPGGDLGQAEIVLIYDRERFETFWLRTDPADGLCPKGPLSADGAGAVLHAPGAVRVGGVPLGGLCGADADLGLWGAALTHRRYL